MMCVGTVILPAPQPAGELAPGWEESVPVTVDCCAPIVCSQPPSCVNCTKFELPWSAAQNDGLPPGWSVVSTAMSYGALAMPPFALGPVLSRYVLTCAPAVVNRCTR